ncbi:MAG: HK97-gp10 family putative phage morphogenesis protein [Bacteroidota bacterium]
MSNVKGLKELLTVLERTPNELDKDVDAIAEANAQEIEAEAKRLAPVDTAKLQQSIAASKVADKTYKIEANANGLAPYAPFVEFGKPVGTGPNGGPRPFLFPAFFKGRRKFTEDLRDLLNNTFNKI